MIYQDRVYGDIKIEEPVILELINSKSVQRLKNIDQAGYPPLYYNPRSLPISELKHDRFEHSIGVYYLLKRYDAPLEEQVAGLIHDVSHAVFSHCIDYALDSGSQKEHSHQDNIFKEFVKNSEIPDTLTRYKLDLNYLLDEKNFPLLEKPLPDLCADRIDYSLMTAVIFKEITQQELQYFLDNLITENNNWIFRNFESAKKYAELFLRLNTFYFAGLHSAVMFRTVGDTVRYALEKGYILESDLYTTDEEVLEKIEEHSGQDKKLSLLLERMNNKVKFENNSQEYDAHVFCKSRIVDPLFKENGKIKRISEVDSNWNKVLERELQPKEYFIKF